MRKILLLFFTLSIQFIYAQTYYSGQVRDAGNGQPIAFVNISLTSTKKGTTSDIDGRFKLEAPVGYKGHVLFSHVSYKKYKITLSELNNQAAKVIFLEGTTTQLDELVFFAGENPAHRIINNAVRNKRENDPERLHSFSYTSYTKQIFKMDGKSDKLDSLLDIKNNISINDSLSLTKEDSLIIKIDSLGKAQHMFMSEAISDMKYLSPGVINEKVIASNVTGTRNPLFAATGSSYQSFGFYKDVISIFDKGFINPISKGSINRYDFFIEDTSYYKTDTVFTISFTPKINKKFDAVKGQVSICTKDFAIKNIIAETADSLSKMKIKVQQLYEYLDDTWFPVQLNTNVVFRDINYFGKQLLMENKRYLSNINIAPEFTKKDFSDIGLALDDVDKKMNQQILNANRLTPLDSLELNTFHFWDTLKSNRMDRMSFLFEALFTNSIPVGNFDLQLDKFIGNNEYEDWRFGLGINTNTRFSKWFSVGGYGAYGIKDKAWKYGGDLNITLNKRTNSTFNFAYKNDIQEVGRVTLFRNANVLSQQLFRSLESNTYDEIELYSFSLNTRVLPFVYSQINYTNTQKEPLYEYSFGKVTEEPKTSFRFSEASFSLRYVKKENYLNFRGKRVFLDAAYPVIAFKYTRGLSDFIEGEFEYNRFDLFFDYEKKHKSGITSLFISGSYIDEDLPFGNLLTGWGMESSNFYAPGLFQTMGLYEFASDKAARFFVSHNFGNVFINSKAMRPELILFHHAGIGELGNRALHQGLDFKTMEKGYLEAGLGFKNLVRMNYLDVGYFGVGVNVFYRYGPYKLDESKDNLAIKINFDFQF